MNRKYLPGRVKLACVHRSNVNRRFSGGTAARTGCSRMKINASTRPRVRVAPLARSKLLAYAGTPLLAKVLSSEILVPLSGFTFVVSSKNREGQSESYCNQHVNRRTSFNIPRSFYSRFPAEHKRYLLRGAINILN